MWLLPLTGADRDVRKRKRRAFRRLSSGVVARGHGWSKDADEPAGESVVAFEGLFRNTLPHPGRRKPRVFASFLLRLPGFFLLFFLHAAPGGGMLNAKK